MGKRIQRVDIDKMNTKLLELGYQDENIHTQVQIDCSSVLWDYPDATAKMTVQAPNGEKYPMVPELADNVVVWDVTDSDLVYAGSGKIQLTLKNGTEVIKSASCGTRIMESITATGPAPTPLENWMQRAEETAHQIALTAKDEVIEEIQDAAEEARESIPADYTQLSDDVTSLKSAFEQLNDNVIVDSAGPAPIVSIADGADGMPMRSVEVAIEPVQDLHGYDNPWPAGGGKNLLDPSLLKDQTGWNTFTLQLKPNTTYTASSNLPFEKTSEIALHFFREGISPGSGTLVSASQPVTITTPESGAVSVQQRRISGTDSFQNYNWQIEEGSSVSSYTPYSNICPITGWTSSKVTRTGKNICDESKLLLASGWTVTDGVYSGPNSALHIAFNANGIPGMKFKQNTQYTISLKFRSQNDNKLTVLAFNYTDGTANGYYMQGSNEQKLAYTSAVGKTIKNISLSYGSSDTIYISQMQVEEGTSASAFEPYQGQTYEVTFPSEAGTVYGGTLDVVTGTLTVTHVCKTVTSCNNVTTASTGMEYASIVYSSESPLPERTSNDSISSEYKYRTNAPSDSGWFRAVPYGTAGVNLLIFDSRFVDKETADSILAVEQPQFCYALASPLAISLDPVTITTLLGQNSIWSNAGNIAVAYPADTKTYIDNRINSTRKLIAGIETGFVASKPYSVGDMLIIGDDLYKVASAIASGATITVGTNVTKTTVAEQLIALANA